ncbi:MAG: hypothetical protein E6H09_04905 [Bacteroidetes bacterium]|jgi:hypothetical protein|nr:MAG: hypothetical protein E6H09_04905 [Bacteroidota bacterium]
MKQRLRKLIPKATKSETTVFSQLPSQPKEETAKSDSKAELSATALFSFFTANIIKEEKIFTR